MAIAARDFAGRSTVAGLFTERAQAQQAIDNLKAAGFDDDAIGVAMRERGAQEALAADSGVHATHATDGAATGGVVGGVLGLLVGLGALAIPGIGPIVSAGVLANALGAGVAGAAIGAVGGGVVGALVGLGLPEHEARHFETGFQAGGVLITVNAGPRAAEAIAILERSGGDTGAAASTAIPAEAQPLYDTAPAQYAPARIDDMATGAYVAPAMGAAAASYAEVDTPPAPASPYAGAGDYKRTHAAEQPASRPAPATVPGDAQTLALHEEVLQAHKEAVQTGEVTLRKETITEMQTIEVPVRREEVVIRRTVGTGESADGEIGTQTEEVARIPVMEEQITLSKEAVVTEEVTLSKREVTETQHFTEAVRREEVSVDNPGGADVREQGRG